MRILAGSLALLLLVTSAAQGQSADRDYLYLWTASADTTQPDFLAVLDVTEGEGDYGRLVTTLPVPGRRNIPHHTEHQLASNILFANGFASGKTFLFDLSNPGQPSLAGTFDDIEGYSHPHSYIRLPGGNVLATFQMRHDAAGMAPGGLAELTPDGKLVRSGSANGEGVDPATRVYSAGVLPEIDRVVTTTTDMEGDNPASRQLQIWRLSDLSLLRTITLPDGARGGESMLTAEPRVLADGRRVLVSTFSCSLYLLDSLETESPVVKLVASFPRTERTFCAIPVISGNYYLVTVPDAIVSLDISDPSAPREASRLSFSHGEVPHWISISPDQRRVVLTGGGSLLNRVVMARFDPATGQLSLDERFREPGATEPGFRMDNKTWPHGGSAKGIPHGAVFSLPATAGRNR